MPWVECHNHKPYEDTMYRTIDENGQKIYEFSETDTLEPWGTTDFEYFYSKPLNSIIDKRRQQLFVDEDFLKLLEDSSLENVTQFDKADIDRSKHTYQIVTQHAMKKGEQICFNYGRCNNRYWIIRYGFAIPDNEYDALAVHVKIDGENEKVVLLHKHLSPDRLLTVSKM